MSKMQPLARPKKPIPWSQQMVEFLKACADETRLRLLNLLAHEGEICVCYLVDVLGTSQPKVSRHLAYLKRAGLVLDRKDGLWVHYRLAETLPPYARTVLNCLQNCCAEVPALQSDVQKLRQVSAAQPIVRLTSRAAVATETSSSVVPAKKTASKK